MSSEPWALSFNPKLLAAELRSSSRKDLSHIANILDPATRDPKGNVSVGELLLLLEFLDKMHSRHMQAELAELQRLRVYLAVADITQSLIGREADKLWGQDSFVPGNRAARTKLSRDFKTWGAKTKIVFKEELTDIANSATALFSQTFTMDDIESILRFTIGRHHTAHINIVDSTTIEEIQTVVEGAAKMCRQPWPEDLEILQDSVRLAVGVYQNTINRAACADFVPRGLWTKGVRRFTGFIVTVAQSLKDGTAEGVKDPKSGDPGVRSLPKIQERKPKIRPGSAKNAMKFQLEKLSSAVEDPDFRAEMENFCILFERYQAQQKEGANLQWDRIQPPHADDLLSFDTLPKHGNGELLSKFALLKFNDRDGATAKCVSPAGNPADKSFVDLSIDQIEKLGNTYDVSISLILFNQRNHNDDAQRITERYKDRTRVNISHINQARYPLLTKDSPLPIPKSFDAPAQEWCSPGRGEVYESLAKSGIMQTLIEKGVEYLLCSDIENFGAAADLRILEYMAESKAEFVMEVTHKTEADAKASTIIKYENTLRLLEITQVPSNRVEEFWADKEYPYIATNNIWLNLQALRNVVKNRELELEVVAKEVTITGSSPGAADLRAIQLQTTAGSAIGRFKNHVFVAVPRERA